MTLVRNYHEAKSLFSEYVASGLSSRLAREATATFGIKVAITILSFVQGLLLARWLGAAGYGAFAYAMSWVAVLGIPAELGFQQLVVRNVATYEARLDWGSMNGLLRRANRTVLIVSLSLAFLAASVAAILAKRFDRAMITFWLALSMLPLVSVTRLRQAAMQGLRHVVASQLPEMLIKPALFIALVGGSHLFLGERLTTPWVMSLNVVAVSVALVVGTHMLYRVLPGAVTESVPVYHIRTWTRSALPLLFISGMFVVYERTAVLMLGAIEGTELVGLYTVANRGAQLVTFVLAAVNLVLGPAAANLYALGEMRRLQLVITGFAWVVLLCSLFIAAFFFVFGRGFLLVFGPEFARAQVALSVLTLGQLVSGAMGSASLLLVMTGHERDSAVGLGIGAVLNVFLNAVLIPRWGMEGAAIATASSTIAWNLLLTVFVYRRLGIHSTILGTISLLGRA